MEEKITEQANLMQSHLKLNLTIYRLLSTLE